MDYLSPITVGTVMFCLIFWVAYKHIKQHKKYSKKIKENLDDEYIIDPNTGTKLTMEQAETGNWIIDDNKLGIVPDTEIEKLYTEEQKEAERAANYIKKNYLSGEFNEYDVLVIYQTKIVAKYNSFNFSNPFIPVDENGYFLFVNVELGTNNDIPYSIGSSYKEQQIMYWLKLDTNLGHYYFREKSSAEKFFGWTQNNNDVKIKGFELFTFEETENTYRLQQILKSFENQKGLEIELLGMNLFIKNLKSPNLKDVYKIEEIVKNIC